jgi:hypothetical protein
MDNLAVNRIRKTMSPALGSYPDVGEVIKPALSDQGGIVFQEKRAPSPA